MLKNFINQAKKNAEKFLNKQETKEAISKLKSEYKDASEKLGKLLDEGDEILKRKVNEVFNDKDSEKSGNVKNPKEEVVVETPKEEVVVETPKEEVVVEAHKEEVVVEAPKEEVVVEAPKEEVVVETPNEVVIKQDTVLKSSDIKISEVCESVTLNNKILEALINEGVETYDQIEDMSDEEILALPSIGKATLKKLREFKY